MSLIVNHGVSLARQPRQESYAGSSSSRTLCMTQLRLEHLGPYGTYQHAAMAAMKKIVIAMEKQWTGEGPNREEVVLPSLPVSSKVSTNAVQ